MKQLTKETSEFKEVEKAIQILLKSSNDNFTESELKKYSSRLIENILNLTSGYKEKIPLPLRRIANNKGDLITHTHIDFETLCSDYLTPIKGKVHIGYIADNLLFAPIVFEDVVRALSKRIQNLDSLASEILDVLGSELETLGIIVFVQAEGQFSAYRNHYTMVYSGDFSLFEYKNKFLNEIKK